MSSQHAFIVGGSSGIGLATAAMMHQLGYEVTIAGRNEQTLNAAKKSLNGAVSTVVLNAADPAQVRKVFADSGTFDHLVLALGSSKGVGPFASTPLADVKQGFDEKVFPHFDCAQAATAILPPSGSITFVSAMTAYAAMPGTAGIGAANAAIAALVPILAAELKPIRVNGVAPGAIDTPWWDFLSSEQKGAVFADMARKTPVGRIGRAEDIARAISFLITDTFMTGQTIICDGGASLTP